MIYIFFLKSDVFFLFRIVFQRDTILHLKKRRKDRNLWGKTNFHCVWKVIVIKKVIADKNRMAKVVVAFFILLKRISPFILIVLVLIWKQQRTQISCKYLGMFEICMWRPLGAGDIYLNERWIFNLSLVQFQ